MLRYGKFKWRILYLTFIKPYHRAKFDVSESLATTRTIRSKFHEFGNSRKFSKFLRFSNFPQLCIPNPATVQISRFSGPCNYPTQFIQFFINSGISGNFRNFWNFRIFHTSASQTLPPCQISRFPGPCNYRNNSYKISSIREFPEIFEISGIFEFSTNLQPKPYHRAKFHVSPAPATTQTIRELLSLVFLLLV